MAVLMEPSLAPTTHAQSLGNAPGVLYLETLTVSHDLLRDFL
jgi:hypothetical protein